MTTYHIKIDRNGNKRVYVRPIGQPGFSIQTNGNLPETHREGVCPATAQEVRDYVASYGTPRQNQALGIYPDSTMKNTTHTRMSFDGRGINEVGGYAERIATLTDYGQTLNVGYLLAAAPDLLAALEGLLADKYLADPINADRMAPARAAIAKATGQR